MLGFVFVSSHSANRSSNSQGTKWMKHEETKLTKIKRPCEYAAHISRTVVRSRVCRILHAKHDHDLPVALADGLVAEDVELVAGLDGLWYAEICNDGIDARDAEGGGGKKGGCDAHYGGVSLGKQYSTVIRTKVGEWECWSWSDVQCVVCIIARPRNPRYRTLL